MSRWTSSLRLRRDSLAVGACLAAFACPAAGWAAGGTPMPAPDDPPGAFATSSSKSSKSTKPSQPAKPASQRCRAPTRPWSARPRLRSRQSHGSSSGPRRRPRHPRSRGRRARLRTRSSRPRLRRAPSAPRRSRARSRSRLPRGRQRRSRNTPPGRMRPPRPRPRRATRFGSAFRPPSSPPATPAAPRAPRCSSRRRSCLPSRREGAPSSASRRGAPRGRHDHAPCDLCGGRRDGGVRSPRRLGRGARSALGELQRRRLRRLVQVERHRLVVVQLERRHGVERLRRVDLDGGHVRRDVHVHRQLRRVVRREQRHRQEGLVAAGRDGVGVPRPGRERVVYEPGELQLHG